ncbi:hypothetical protein ElyMa_006162200 [Elysia marginata]|uniref:Uncharacterized protein n=1 Tax=Elysia marginata TaxID=1093978 RepID=A0AAV4GZM7_9GAST|nr:hypothetical protein ElyMa_006162200 [Elysia marginata]
MFEKIFLDFGYAGVATESMVVVLYLVLSAQLCMLVSWPWNTYSGHRRRARIYTAGLLGGVLLLEASLAFYGLVVAWRSLLWDVTAVATVKALLSAALFIVYDGPYGKIEDVHQPVEELDEEITLRRRRRPGG